MRHHPAIRPSCTIFAAKAGCFSVFIAIQQNCPNYYKRADCQPASNPQPRAVLFQTGCPSFFATLYLPCSLPNRQETQYFVLSISLSYSVLLRQSLKVRDKAAHMQSELKNLLNSWQVTPCRPVPAPIYLGVQMGRYASQLLNRDSAAKLINECSRLSNGWVFCRWGFRTHWLHSRHLLVAG